MAAPDCHCSLPVPIPSPNDRVAMLGGFPRAGINGLPAWRHVSSSSSSVSRPARRTRLLTPGKAKDVSRRAVAHRVHRVPCDAVVRSRRFAAEAELVRVATCSNPISWF